MAGWLGGLPYTAEGLDKKAEELKYSRPFCFFCDTTFHLFENSVSRRYIHIIALFGGPFVFELANGRHLQYLEVNNIMLLTPWTSIRNI